MFADKTDADLFDIYIVVLTVIFILQFLCRFYNIMVMHSALHWWMVMVALWL